MIIIILRIIRAGTTFVSNSFNFSWKLTIYFGFQLKLKELLTSVVPALVILIIIIIPFSPKTSNCSCNIEHISILKKVLMSVDFMLEWTLIFRLHRYYGSGFLL